MLIGFVQYLRILNSFVPFVQAHKFQHIVVFLIFQLRLNKLIFI